MALITIRPTATDKDIANAVAAQTTPGLERTAGVMTWDGDPGRWRRFQGRNALTAVWWWICIPPKRNKMIGLRALVPLDLPGTAGHDTE